MLYETKMQNCFRLIFNVWCSCKRGKLTLSILKSRWFITLWRLEVHETLFSNSVEDDSVCWQTNRVAERGSSLAYMWLCICPQKIWINPAERIERNQEALLCQNWFILTLELQILWFYYIFAKTSRKRWQFLTGPVLSLNNCHLKVYNKKTGSIHSNEIKVINLTQS